jgi:hypothetical protein
MFNSSVLDVAIGMVFVYLLLSLMCSAANETVELALKNRAKDLERGLRQLLQDADGKGLVKKVYDHPLVSALFEGNYKPTPQGRIGRILARVTLPSYIPARTFALALMDTILPAQQAVSGGTAGATPSAITPDPSSLTAIDTLRKNIASLGNEEVQRALRALVDAADNDVAKARENIEKWFDSSMDRVSGWYKRRAQIFLLVLGFVLAIFVNADSVLIAQRLSADKALRDTVVSAAQDYARVNAEQSRQSTLPSPSPSPKSSPSPSPSLSPSQSPKSSPSPGATPPASSSASPPTSPTGHAAQTGGGASAKSSPSPCEAAQCKYDDSLNQLKKLALPIGWDSTVEGQQFPGLRFWTGGFWSGWTWQIRVHILGWFLTALAVSLGAPFWFDLLNKFIVVRSTVKPKEKSPEEKSKD